MRKIILFLFSAALLLSCNKPVDCLPLPSLPQFNKVYGGTQRDEADAIANGADGSYAIAGLTFSNNGNVIGKHGGTETSDAWVVKLDKSGHILWQKALGGSGNEYAKAIITTTDGGYVMAGYAESKDGDVSGNRYGDDAWVVKLSSSGHIVWQKTFGGSGQDLFNTILATPDGGYIAAGLSGSNDGDVSGNHGQGDAWVVKLDASGNLVWQKALGGSIYDDANSIIAAKDGGYIMAGYSFSNDGDVSGSHGSSDAWIVKLSTGGNIEWQKTLGGTRFDAATSVTATTDGGYVMAGYTYSSDGDVSGFKGGIVDAWVVKLSTNGSKMWQKTLGGSGDEVATSIKKIPGGGYIIVGATNSNDGDMTGNHGGSDAWIIKLSEGGNNVWHKTVGGSADDGANAVIIRSEESYVIAGGAKSNNGDVSGNHGDNDAWVFTEKGE